MDDTRSMNKRLEGAAWGSLLLWIGTTYLVRGLPAGTGALGIGAILIALNVARWFLGVPPKRLTTAVGALTLAFGAALLGARFLFGVPHVRVPLLPTLFLAGGILCLVGSLGRRETNSRRFRRAHDGQSSVGA